MARGAGGSRPVDGPADIASGVLNGRPPRREELAALAGAAQSDPTDLIQAAWQVRRARFGRRAAVCSIVAGKVGGCSEDCAFCAQSARHGGAGIAPRHTTTDEIRSAAAEAARAGASCFGIVNSGRRPSEADLDAVLEAAATVRSEGMCLSASLGELTDDQAARLADAGFGRYNHNLETSRRFYPRIATTHSYDDRLRTLDACRNAGLDICCGGIFGLGETWDDRIDLALTLRDRVRPDVVPLNFLHPIPGTPLADRTPLPPMEILAVVAVFRLALPEADIKIAGGREKNLRDLQSWMFHAGATSTMVGNYLTTTGRPTADDLRMIEDLGLELVGDLFAGR